MLNYLTLTSKVHAKIERLHLCYYIKYHMKGVLKMISPSCEHFILALLLQNVPTRLKPFYRIHIVIYYYTIRMT